MPCLPDEILADREDRSRWIRGHCAADCSVVSVHANIPGSNKNLSQARLIVEWIASTLPFSAETYDFRHGPDGPCALFVFRNPPETVKKRCVVLEETDPLGRFADVDVWDESGLARSRSGLRKCFLCDRPAFVCGREKTHPETELLNHLAETVDRCVEAFVSETVDSAILDELNLDPKFGLVTPTSSGSHPDMDYDLMVRAAAAIKPYLMAMFRRGYFGIEEPRTLFASLRPLGIEAEGRMLETTGGVNAYQGLIFSFGIVLSAVGILLSGRQAGDTVFDVVRKMTPFLLQELEGTGESQGFPAWREHRFGGARKEAHLGFPSVEKALPFLKTPGKTGLTLALTSLIGSVEDSVLLRRCGSFEAFQAIQKKIGAIRRYDPQEIRETTDWCVSRHLSFGGAADLLAVTAFLHRLSARFPGITR